MPFHQAFRFGLVPYSMKRAARPCPFARTSRFAYN
jgi:hypothetical protein